MKQKKRFVLILGIIIYLIVIPISIKSYDDYQVYEHGNLTNVEVLGIRMNDLEFLIEGKLYAIKLSRYSNDEYKKGDKIQVRYLKGYDNLLFRYENPIGTDILLLAMMLFMSNYFLYYFFRKGNDE